MSRIAKKPIHIPLGVSVVINKQHIQIKGPKGNLEYIFHINLNVKREKEFLIVVIKKDFKLSSEQSGTTRALINNMIIGVNEGFRRKLILNGVGYKATVSNNTVILVLGFSHLINYKLPEGIQVETPNINELVITGIDKQKVGKTAAEIRSYRQPDPYKGKGIRYENERIILKEAKKK